MRRIRLMRRKWAAIATRILRVSHFLRAIARRGASAGIPALTLHAGNTPGSSRPLARITTRGKREVNVHGDATGPEGARNVGRMSQWGRMLHRHLTSGPDIS